MHSYYNHYHTTVCNVNTEKFNEAIKEASQLWNQSEGCIMQECYNSEIGANKFYIDGLINLKPCSWWSVIMTTWSILLHRMIKYHTGALVCT